MIILNINSDINDIIYIYIYIHCLLNVSIFQVVIGVIPIDIILL